MEMSPLTSSHFLDSKELAVGIQSFFDKIHEQVRAVRHLVYIRIRVVQP